MATLVELLAHKRNGHPHTEGDIRRLISAFQAGELADYQLSAWLMASFLRGLDTRETLELTEAMLHSGQVLDLSDIAGIKVDKHSTGGVGDKISIALAPLVASCGVPVPMVSGRGLGHTGGTLDKLEAIPGFQVNLDIETFRRGVREIGTCMIGQTKEIAPADKRIYALRDVTATVESIPLITASILSKKLAEGIDALVLDVKVGRGAFMKSHEDAKALAESLVRVAARGGKRVSALLTDMDHPIGLTIGNALETIEAFDILHGKGPQDSVDLTLALAVEMLLLGNAAQDKEDAISKLGKAISSGKALETLERMIAFQGGNPKAATDYSLFDKAPVIERICATRSGTITDINPLTLGLAAVELGAGRTRTDQTVDHAVGFVLRVNKGQSVAHGDTLIEIHARNEADVRKVRARVESAFRCEDKSAERSPLLLETIRA